MTLRIGVLCYGQPISSASLFCFPEWLGILVLAATLIPETALVADSRPPVQDQNNLSSRNRLEAISPDMDIK